MRGASALIEDVVHDPITERRISALFVPISDMPSIPGQYT
jgi:hypothetical protein